MSTPSRRFSIFPHTHPASPCKIADIAKRQKIPQKFLELILASLKQGGFVESRRGAEGGYLLARAADAITVGEVLRFVEGARDEKTRTRRQAESPFSRYLGSAWIGRIGDAGRDHVCRTAAGVERQTRQIRT